MSILQSLLSTKNVHPKVTNGNYDDKKMKPQNKKRDLLMIFLYPIMNIFK